MVISGVFHRVPTCTDDGGIIYGRTVCDAIDAYLGNVMIAEETEQSMLALTYTMYVMCDKGCFSELERQVFRNATCWVLQEDPSLAGREDGHE